ncbi:MAG: hypothetical protein ABI870_02660 [Rhodanobacter sp.]
MYKQIGLALCLCTMAMGLNSVLAADNEVKPKQDMGAYSVTISPTEWVDAAPAAEKKQPSGPRAAHATTAKVAVPCHTTASHRSGGSHADACSRHGAASP